MQFSRCFFAPSRLRALVFRRGFFESFAPSGLLCKPFEVSGFFRSLKTIQLREDSQFYLASLGCFIGVCTPLLSKSLSIPADRPSSELRCFHLRLLPRKEVIQPHLPIRLPCYDFTPVIGLTFDGWLLSVTSPASGAPNSHGVTGGVYKARERIHRGMLIRDY